MSTDDPVQHHRRKSDRPQRTQRKGMYIVPSLFTIANMAAGYYAILQIVHASVNEPWHLDNAAKAIGFAILFDNLDGSIARLTGTSSDFGRELDSLADVITFGVAPAFLAWMWGFRLLPPVYDPALHTRLLQFGATASFLYLVAGAARLARFNITTNPEPSNPGRPGRKYFVGMPIPSGAGVIAAVVHRAGGEPLANWYTSCVWLAVMLVVGFLMVSTWRFFSLKGVHFNTRQPFRLVLIIALLFTAIWFESRWVLFLLAITYVFSGVFWRLQWLFRRRPSPPTPPAYKEASQAS
jgi:CDP-diacylglycerol--serine O-phosphatidyltransferase